MVKSKKLGLGSSSFFISIFAMFFSCLSLRDGKLGEVLLRSINLPLDFSIVSLLLFIIALIIGYKYREDLFANIGIVLSKIFIFFSICFTILGLIQKFI